MSDKIKLQILVMFEILGDMHDPNGSCRRSVNLSHNVAIIVPIGYRRGIPNKICIEINLLNNLSQELQPPDAAFSDLGDSTIWIQGISHFETIS
jgi:hypothetical protein